MNQVATVAWEIAAVGQLVGDHLHGKSKLTAERLDGGINLAVPHYSGGITGRATAPQHRRTRARLVSLRETAECELNACYLVRKTAFHIHDKNNRYLK